jgi:hypothetical protein
MFRSEDGRGRGVGLRDGRMERTGYPRREDGGRGLRGDESGSAF